MKTHVLAASILLALGSGATLAASEDGDTWSAVQPAVYPVERSSVALNAQRPDSATSAVVGTWSRSEGGDTWSAVQALQGSTNSQIGLQDAVRSADAVIADHSGRSEGGDTWSQFITQPAPNSTSMATVASKRTL